MTRQPRRLARSVMERPQRPLGKGGILSAAIHQVFGYWHRWAVRRDNSHAQIARQIVEAGRALEDMDAASFDDHLRQLRACILTDASNPAAIVALFAAISEAAYRAIGQRPYETQLRGAIAIYHGEIAEMQTGEGKTLTAVLPAAAAALAGVPVHVLTVNDYLAARDAERMGPIFQMLGLSVGVVVQDTPLDQRGQVYGCDVVYCSNKEVAFDFMRDSIVIGDLHHPLLRHAERLRSPGWEGRALALRGLHYAIVDEADSVLLDEARTPLVISGAAQRNVAETKIFQEALHIANELAEGVHFQVQALSRQLEITALGETHIGELAKPLSHAWAGRRRRLELVRLALVAQHLFHRDAHYLVRDDKVIIIDENTGRPMPDRNWEQGLHQLIEIKEGVPLTKVWEPIARMTLQRFFRLYHHLGGMTGTAREVADEIWGTYNAAVRAIPTHRPSRLNRSGVTVLTTMAEKWHCVAERAECLRAQGRSVLIGTRTVCASEELSAVLEAAGLAHRVLNARQDQEEASIIAKAGQHCAITIATNMAGRGTDIMLDEAVRDAGGLHVIVTELHDSARLDRQLIGRAGRQGDPGSFEIIASLEDEILVRSFSGFVKWLAGRAVGERRTKVALALMRFLQWRTGRLHAGMRADLLRADEHEQNRLAFAGRGESG